MSFKLPKLSYSYKDFEPFIDEKTMEVHYTKHHATYTDNLNKSICGSDLLNLSIEEILRRANIEKLAVRNNSGGYYNHNLYWKILVPYSEYLSPSQYLNDIIKIYFDSFESFKNKFSSEAMNRFGSGWAWLCVKNKNELTICSTQNQDNPLMLGIGCEGKPILGLDVWEHAYYLKYQNRRLDYISSFWKIINWKQVEKNYKEAIQ